MPNYTGVRVQIPPLTPAKRPGSYLSDSYLFCCYLEKRRNHCPNCLTSLHIDNQPGDRLSNCGGHMEPIGVWIRKNGEWALIHRCKRCGKITSNRIAADDNPMKLMAIALKPLCEPPFPVERIQEMSDAMGYVGSFK